MTVQTDFLFTGCRKLIQRKYRKEQKPPVHCLEIGQVMYQIETAKRFWQAIPTAVNDRRRTYTTVNERKTQANHAKQDGAGRSSEAKASNPQQKLPFASKSYHLQPNANQKFIAQHRALSALCYPASTSNQPQTNTQINTPSTHSFPHNGGLYRLLLFRV